VRHRPGRVWCHGSRTRRPGRIQLPGHPPDRASCHPADPDCFPIHHPVGTAWWCRDRVGGRSHPLKSGHDDDHDNAARLSPASVRAREVRLVSGWMLLGAMFCQMGPIRGMFRRLSGLYLLPLRPLPPIFLLQIGINPVFWDPRLLPINLWMLMGPFRRVLMIFSSGWTGCRCLDRARA
jgi:hypothetical protein